MGREQRWPQQHRAETLPVIDIAPFLQGTAEGKARVFREVGQACEGLGFLIVTGHGVPAELVQRTYDVALRFFDRPIEEKLKLSSSSGGYVSVGSRGLARTRDAVTPPDLSERFSYRGDLDRSPWEQGPADFKPILSQYFQAMNRLATTFMHIFALALDLPETYFDHTFGSGPSTLTVIHYPEQKDEPLSGQLRAGEHTDYGTLTILRIDGAAGGLQVHKRQGEWIDVRPVPGSFVINIGDMMARWTNDHWISTLHRVANPPRDTALGNRRLSLVFFHNLNPDAVVSCLETCTGPDDPPKYPPINAETFNRMKIQKSLVQGRTPY